MVSYITYWGEGDDYIEPPETVVPGRIHAPELGPIKRHGTVQYIQYVQIVRYVQYVHYVLYSVYSMYSLYGMYNIYSKYNM